MFHGLKSTPTSAEANAPLTSGAAEAAGAESRETLQEGAKMGRFGFNGLAGCVTQRLSAVTGRKVGLYAASEAGLCSAGGQWVTVCEDHGNLLNHASETRARQHLDYTHEWCEACRAASEPSLALTPEAYPKLRANARSLALFDFALDVINAGVKAGSIRNTELQDAKLTLSRAAERAWEKVVSEPFFYAGRWERRAPEVQALYNDITIMGLHSVQAAAKRVAKSTAEGPEVDAMRAFCAEALPLALAVASLKDKVVKGRAPNTGLEPSGILGAVVKKTCPCCFRPIAVVREKMAHHGYTRPGQGWQTASCPGVRFKPLEVSSEGLEWLITTLRDRLKMVQESYRHRDKRDSLFVRKAGTGRKIEFETITRESPSWARHFEALVAELKAEIRSLKGQLPMLERKLAAWKPEVQQ